MSRHLSLSALLFFLICLTILTVPLNVQAQTTTVSINPHISNVLHVGDTFPVNVTVGNVNLLFAWEFQIYYNSGILNASNWTPGPRFASPNMMIFNQTWTDNYNATHGLVDIVCTSIGQGTFNGTTILATVYFKAKSFGTAVLGLPNASLLDNSDPFPQEIPNTTTGGTVVVGSIPGDLNGDGKVSLTDLVILALAYGSRSGDAKWNQIADIDGNGVVGLTDLVIVALHYGQHNP
jgi:hypothetical protein